MHLCARRRMAFLHNPKCAGMAVGRYLESLGFVQVGDREWPHEILLREEHRNWLVFTTARDPWERWASYYRYLVQHLNDCEFSSLELFTLSRPSLLAMPLQSDYIARADVVIPTSRLEDGLQRIGLLRPGRSLERENRTEIGPDESLADLSELARAAFFERFRGDYRVLSLRGLFWSL